MEIDTHPNPVQRYTSPISPTPRCHYCGAVPPCLPRQHRDPDAEDAPPEEADRG